ncbi:hypothetical protein [Duganella sp. CF517]|uniref:hypothetical protein n=1 Tax=Duganella sp. CF517 TaxID=1881038 RepID=UPI0011607CCD|nr:hypothetical protein [Duganella sp. CF517]
MNFSIRKFPCAVILTMLCILCGCEDNNRREKVSDDATAFQNLVTVDIPYSAVRWEVFGTPEYTGGIPGPTDYVTLVAQIVPTKKQSDLRVGSETVWLAPESARPWPDPDFSSFVRKNLQNSEVDLAKHANCRPLSATLTKTSKPVRGFACSGKAKTLIYLRIADHT